MHIGVKMRRARVVLTGKKRLPLIPRCTLFLRFCVLRYSWIGHSATVCDKNLIRHRISL
jgi:hypothetical protein